MVTEIISDQLLDPRDMMRNEWPPFSITNNCLVVCKSKWATQNKTTIGLVNVRNNNNFDKHKQPVNKW